MIRVLPMPHLPHLKPRWRVESWDSLDRRPVVTESGRGVISLIDHPEGLVVERPYRHGGLRRFLFPKAFRVGPRAKNEFEIHQAAFEGGVSTCERVGWSQQPCGIPFFRHYFFYSQFLPGATVLPQWLDTNGLSTKQARQMAKIIFRLYELGIRHTDLNLNNWLVSGDQIFIIDFDRGEFVRQDPQTYLGVVLRRMLRSGRKLGINKPGPFLRFVVQVADLFSLNPRDLLGLASNQNMRRRWYHRILWKLSGGHVR